MTEPNESDEKSKDGELGDAELDGVSGGVIADVCKRPVPGGPVPIPYPNDGTTTK